MRIFRQRAIVSGPQKICLVSNPCAYGKAALGIRLRFLKNPVTLSSGAGIRGPESEVEASQPAGPTRKKLRPEPL